MKLWEEIAEVLERYGVDNSRHWSAITFDANGGDSWPLIEVTTVYPDGPIVMRTHALDPQADSPIPDDEPTPIYDALRYATRHGETLATLRRGRRTWERGQVIYL